MVRRIILSLYFDGVLSVFAAKAEIPGEGHNLIKVQMCWLSWANVRMTVCQRRSLFVAASTHSPSYFKFHIVVGVFGLRVDSD